MTSSAAPHPSRPPLVVVMGVSGTGKSTVGELLAQRLEVAYEDGDQLHTPQAIAKMRSGQALGDADREPWLRMVGDWLATHQRRGGVMSCSALRRAYRDVLRAAAPDVVFLHLTGPDELIHARMEERRHFMPVALLESQLAALQPLADEEPGHTLDVTQTPTELVEDFLRRLGR